MTAAPDTKENGEMDLKMDKVHNHSAMDPDMKVNGEKVRKKVKVPNTMELVA